MSVTVRRGEIVALIGANGAGKTTTLRAVSNLLQAERGRITAGEIRFADHDVLRMSPSKLVRLSFVQVLEGRHCFPTLTVEETSGRPAKSLRSPTEDDDEEEKRGRRRARERLRDPYGPKDHEKTGTCPKGLQDSTLG